MLRQGDVLLLPLARAPRRKLTRVCAEGGRLILARGEATGHHHSVDAKVAILNLDEGGVMFLTVGELTEVRHQEHDPVTLVPGTYKVRRQREYTPEVIRNVAD